MPVGEIRGKRLAVNSVGSNPRQCGFVRWYSLIANALDLHDQSLVGRKIERFVRDDNLAVEMCADRHHATPLFQYRSNQHVFQGRRLTSPAWRPNNDAETEAGLVRGQVGTIVKN